jgi:hypothetical protein
MRIDPQTEANRTRRTRVGFSSCIIEVNEKHSPALQYTIKPPAPTLVLTDLEQGRLLIAQGHIGVGSDDGLQGIQKRVDAPDVTPQPEP